MVLGRALKLCNFIDYQDIKVNTMLKYLQQKVLSGMLAKV